jgi:hypothetical protein
VNTDGSTQENCKDANQPEAVSADEEESVADKLMEAKRRECPVPKPGGILGDMLGFRYQRSTREEERGSSRPP